MSSTRLFVGNVPENTTNRDLETAFSAYGKIINVDLKSKSGAEIDQNKFAFITLSASNYEVESCIKHFSNEDFGGHRLYVTRARESFLERLQRERQEAQQKEAEKNEPYHKLPKKNPVIKLSDKLNPRKRKLDSFSENNKVSKPYETQKQSGVQFKDNKNEHNEVINNMSEKDKKKQDADKKRMESIKKKRQEFKQKQMIIKSGLVGIDKVPNKKVIFSDSEETGIKSKDFGTKKLNMVNGNNKNSLFDDDESGDDVNFEIKKQFEGKKGQKVLDLQSRYKSDKRFILDERFIEDDHSEEEKDGFIENNEQIDLGEADEKNKQLNILQDVLGVTIKRKSNETDNRKTKTKIGMLRFDPTQPEHAKFLAPVEETKQETSKKSKKKKSMEKQHEEQKAENIIMKEVETEKVQVSKEQFYTVSDTLKEALVQPATFSLRSLFAQNQDGEKDVPEQDSNYIPLEKPKSSKVKNPLEPATKNPFVYDSSDSETEEPEKQPNVVDTLPVPLETKAVWKENLFFVKSDNRLKDGLAFFNKPVNNETQKERRELKSVMKKRVYNKERKNQMFQKKIGGRKKSMKKSYRKKS